ncbi:hypothetical protein BZL29_8449 [Mycobacterium kansasii]|uniref:Uncharacterized protein n=1 Tax=Mycobacterium kansasii TaxID=1768 RepID=A0A1V3W9V9_MYCKA|nr:hypothetical protein BZL29_8449 [Mycobacterium kansasii]
MPGIEGSRTGLRDGQLVLVLAEYDLLAEVTCRGLVGEFHGVGACCWAASTVMTSAGSTRQLEALA